MRLSLSLVALIACRGKSEPPPQPAPAPSPTIACEPTIREAAKRIAAESKRVDLDSKAERRKLTMIASCEADNWPASVTGCIAAARLDVDLDACTEQLTHRQWVQLHDKFAALEPPPQPTPTPPPVAARPNPTPRVAIDPPAGVRRPTGSCEKRVLDPTDRNCVAQFCKGNGSDPRCMIE